MQLRGIGAGMEQMLQLEAGIVSHQRPGLGRFQERRRYPVEIEHRHEASDRQLHQPDSGQARIETGAGMVAIRWRLGGFDIQPQHAGSFAAA